MTALGSGGSLDDLNLDLNLDVSGDSVDGTTTTDTSESEDDDVFDEEFTVGFYKSNTIDPLQLKNKRDVVPGNDENDETLINKVIGKHGPAPPQHSHNIRAQSRNRGSSFAHSDTGGSAISITSYSEKSAITPDQWRFIKHKMHGLAPILIEAINNGDTHVDIDSPELHIQDTTSELYAESENSSNSAHPSDDEVLTDPQLMQNDTLSTIITPTTVSKKQKSKGHEYKASMTVSFDPQGYDHVVNALDVLQTFCTSVPGVHPTSQQQKQYDMESNHDTDEGTDSDDEVLHRDFDKHNAEYSHAIGEEINNKHSEYEQLRFDIVNSTISRSISNTNNSKQSKKSKKTNPKTINDSDSENDHNNHTHKATENTANTKHHRRVTPVPLKRPKSKPNKKDNISFSEILSLANNRNNTNIASPSSYLMPAAIHNPHKPLSPSHSVDAQSQTEISVDHADEYEYRAMADGGMQRISQSYAIPPGIKSDRVGSREISTVDVILEEHENEYEEHINNSTKDMVGVILKQPSVSQTTTIPIASPTGTTPVNNNSTEDIAAGQHRIMRGSSLGIPQAAANHRNSRRITDHDRNRNASYASNNTKSINNSTNNEVNHSVVKEEANKMQRVYSKMESEPEDMMQTSSFALAVHSPQSGKYNEHNRENSMEVEYDERSAFKEDIYATNYTPQSKSNSMLKHRHPHTQYNSSGAKNHMHQHHHKQYKFNVKPRKKRSKHIHVDSNENYETHNDEIQMVETTKKSSQSSTDKSQTKRQYTQYAVRSSDSEKRLMSAESLEDDSLNELEHQHMIILHDDDHDGRTDKKAISYLEFSSNKWTKWILLAALSICFILGVFMGFGVSWIFFVTD